MRPSGCADRKELCARFLIATRLPRGGLTGDAAERIRVPRDLPTTILPATHCTPSPHPYTPDPGRAAEAGELGFSPLML